MTWSDIATILLLVSLVGMMVWGASVAMMAYNGELPEDDW